MQGRRTAFWCHSWASEVHASKLVSLTNEPVMITCKEVTGMLTGLLLCRRGARLWTRDEAWGGTWPYESLTGEKCILRLSTGLKVRRIYLCLSVCLFLCLFFFQIYFGLNTNRAIKISPMLKQKPYNTIRSWRLLLAAHCQSPNTASRSGSVAAWDTASCYGPGMVFMVLHWTCSTWCPPGLPGPFLPGFFPAG